MQDTGSDLRNREHKEKVTVVGSGLMGRGIGQSFATAGYAVALVDLDGKILEGALKQIKNSLDQLAQAGIVGDAEKILDRISPEINLASGVRGSSLVDR